MSHATWAVGHYGITSATSPPRYVYSSSLSRPQLFLDVDFDSDVDDVVDVLLAIQLHIARSLDISGIVATSGRQETAPAILSLLHYYGLDSINVGKNLASPGNILHSYYGATLASSYGVAGRTTSAGFESALAVQRYTLNSASTNSIDYMTTGDLSSVKRLLESSAGDTGVNVSGADLISTKVKALWVVGGYWPTGIGVSDFGGSAAVSAVSNYVLANWPSSVPIYLVDLADGDTVETGETVMTALNVANPARVAWELYFAESDPTNKRPAWSQIAILALTFGLGSGYMEVAATGTASVNSSSGVTAFSPGAGGHRYLQKVMSDANLVAAINAYIDEP